MKRGDIVIPKITKVSTCGTIIFQAGHEYSIIELEYYDTAVIIHIDSEWGSWVIDNHELTEKFTYISLRNKKITSIINFLSDGNKH